MKSNILKVSLVALSLASCNNKDELSDAYGNFEATEIIVSSEANGKIMEFKIEEGQELKSGEVVGYIDTVALSLKRKQLQATRAGVASKTANINAQVNVLKEQKAVALKEQARIEKLFKDNAATGKQVDDVKGQIDVLDQQIKSIETQNVSVFNELKSMDSQIEQVNDQLRKSLLKSPIDGMVLAKYTNAAEVVPFGKPLFKIADMNKMILRVYVSGGQLSQVKLGQKIKVLIDETSEKLREMEGEITWVSANAEFTPKIIQTKEERVNLVYAVKVAVKNDGTLKIGMPGEIRFKN